MNNEVLVKENDSHISEFDRATMDSDSLVSCDIVLVGDKEDRYKVGENILVRRDALSNIKHTDFKDYKIIFNALQIFCKCNN